MVGTGSTVAHATSMIAVTVEEMAEESDALVQAVVGRRTVLPTARGLYTDSVLTVERVLGGTAPDTIRVRQIGGTLGDQAERIAGDARLVPGQRIVAFVRQVDGRWYFTALGQSVWHVTGEGPDASVHRDVQASELLKRDVAGRVVLADESLPEYATLGELLHACRELRFGGTP